MRRSCSRPGCAAPAGATFSYEYASSTVWLEDLTPEAHPSTYDLCANHAGRLTPPRGWQLADHRGGPRAGQQSAQQSGQPVAAGHGAIAS